MKRFLESTFLACALMGLSAAGQAQPFPTGRSVSWFRLPRVTLRTLPRAPWAKRSRGC
jgi:hypothetical protein